MAVCTLLLLGVPASRLDAQSTGLPVGVVSAPVATPVTIPVTTPTADSSVHTGASGARPHVFALPTRRWIPRHVSLGVGGVATSAPGRGTTYSPTMGGMFDISLIGYLTPRVTWRAEGFLHLQDRSRASERALLGEPAENTPLCDAPGCAANPRETSRRSS